MCGRGRVVVDQGRAVILAGCAVSPAALENARCELAAERTGERRCEHDPGEVDPEEKDADERRRRDGPQYAMLQRARADAPRCEQHHRHHRRLDAVENALHQRHVAPGQIDAAQHREQQEGRQEEQHASQDGTLRAVHQPRDVDSELNRLRPGQQHAVVEAVQVAVFGDPAAFFHQLLMHHRDLSGGAAEADEAEFEPVFEGLPEGDGRGACGVQCGSPKSRAGLGRDTVCSGSRISRGQQLTVHRSASGGKKHNRWLWVG